jgi:hypothetical protein
VVWKLLYREFRGRIRCVKRAEISGLSTSRSTSLSLSHTANCKGITQHGKKKTKERERHDPTCKGKWTPALRNYTVLTNGKRAGEGKEFFACQISFVSIRFGEKKGRRAMMGVGLISCLLQDQKNTKLCL